MAAFGDYGIDGDELNPPSRHFDDNDVVVVESFSGYDSFSSGFPSDHPQPDEYVAVDHSSSPGVFGFEDPNPSYADSSPFGSIHAENGNGNGYGYDAGESDGVFAADGPVLPPPADMAAEDGFALREWRR